MGRLKRDEAWSHPAHHGDAVQGRDLRGATPLVNRAGESRLALAVGLAALGLIAHNLLSLPLSPLAPETVGPVLVYAALLGWADKSRLAAPSRLSLLAWTVLNLAVGGILTVLPFPFLPFVPEQGPSHYLAHAIYSLAQLPLIGMVLATERGPVTD